MNEPRPGHDFDDVNEASSAHDAATVGAGPEGAPGPPDDFGDRFKVMGRLGSGGFGDVYLAEQLEPVRRRVAIKVIKLGMDTRDVISRFDAEREALAMMDHPCIARVLDAGATRQGRPYFVMEWVRGEPLTDYCDRHRLSLRQRIELFIDVCAAVQHAHHKGVIHRDLKPSNVLITTVDDRPVPKVIDFGIAKATAGALGDRSIQTLQGDFVGTPQYMAPEQADGGPQDVDTRADIYALGATLYEVLTGVTPVDPESLKTAGKAAIPRLVAEHEATRPSTRLSSLGEQIEEIAKRRQETGQRLRRELRGELDWILMKALERDRRRRYDTANGLAMDLRRYLDDDPVLASPPSARYRASKFVRRHRAGVAVAATIAIALITTGALLAGAFVQVRHDRDEAQRARDEAEAVTTFLVDTLGTASPGELGREVTVREAMDEAALDLEGAFSGSPATEARIRDAIGRTYLALGQHQQAAPHLERALALRTSAFGVDDARTLASRRARGEGLYALGLYDEAEHALVETIAEQRVTLGGAHAETLATMVSLARLYSDAARVDEAESLLREVIGVMVARGDLDAALEAMNILAVVLGDDRRFEAAEPLLAEVLDDLIDRRGASHPDALSAQSNMVWLLTGQEKLDEAIAIGERALPLARASFGDEHPETLTLINNLAVAYRRAGRYEEAEPLLREDLAVSRRVLGDRHPDTLVTLANMGRFLLESGRPTEAEPLFAEAAAGVREVVGPDFYGLGITQLGHGRTLLALERHDEAIEALLEAHRILERAFGPNDGGVRVSASSLATAYGAIGNDEESRRWAGRAGDQQDDAAVPEEGG